MEVDVLVTEIATGRPAKVTAKNGNWQIEIAYVDSDGKCIHPNAIAWLHPSKVKREKKLSNKGNCAASENIDINAKSDRTAEQ